jgi:hypothetical protein
MQDLNFGRLENLQIQQGDPLFDPPPRVIREIKFGGENGPRPELAREDFVLKAQVTELFDHLSNIGSGSVAMIEVKHGLPFRLVMEQSM